MNRLQLEAQVSERGSLRYTPAGLPALDLLLQHDSDLVHEGQPRRVSVSIKALEMAEEKEAIAQYGSADAGASLGDILGAALKKANKKDEAGK